MKFMYVYLRNGTTCAKPPNAAPLLPPMVKLDPPHLPPCPDPPIPPYPQILDSVDVMIALLVTQ